LAKLKLIPGPVPIINATLIVIVDIRSKIAKLFQNPAWSMNSIRKKLCFIFGLFHLRNLQLV
jgi:hypothetical protein